MTQEQKTELRKLYEQEHDRMTRERREQKRKAERDYLDYICGVSESINRRCARHKRR